MLFNEPKLLKFLVAALDCSDARGFSALQRAEIAEIRRTRPGSHNPGKSFSALQRAEIAEMRLVSRHFGYGVAYVSVLFNEPKLLKSRCGGCPAGNQSSFSALQRAEIAEIGIPMQEILERLDVSVLFNEPKLLK